MKYEFKGELKYYALFIGMVLILGVFAKAIEGGETKPYMGYIKKYDGSLVKVAEAANITATPSPDISGQTNEGRVYFDLFKKYFGEDAEIMYAVARCESGLKEDAYNTYNRNKTVDIGLLQINSIHWNKEGCDPKTLLTAEGNLKCAKKIYDTQGKRAWSAFNSGCYKDFL